jgi:oligosaccharyltransferase complex subunit beta
MLDPYIRTNLLPSNKTDGAYVTPPSVRLPDQHGVFSCKVDYFRRGYSFVNEKSTISLRPFRHNEYPRFLTAAYPYYTGAWSMIVGFVLFSAVFLFSSDEKFKKQ